MDASSYYLYALNPAIGDAQDFGSGTELRGPYLPCTVVGACASPHTSYLSVTLPSGATSFGLDLMTAYPQAQSFTIQLDSIDVGLVITTQARPTRTFFGVTTDAPISQVRITLNSGVINQTQGLFDNFAYGAAGTSGGGGTTDPSGDTPEVATMLCVGSGLMAMRLLRRRQTPALATA